MFFAYIVGAYIIVYLFFYGSCRLRVIPRSGMMAWFAICFVHMTLAMNIGSLLLTVIPRKVFGVRKEQTEKYCMILCKYLFSALIYSNPQIHLDISPEVHNEWAKIPPNSCTAINHTSFLDAFLIATVGPHHYVTTCRTMAKASLMDIPIFGAIFQRVGHFPVYFISDDEGNFSVDKQQQAPVMERVKQYVSSGGRLALCPEGAVNKTPRQLKPFRVGTFAMILELQLPLYYVVTNGNETIWPAKARVGGLPGTVSVRVGQCEVREKDDANTLAERLQKLMQKEVDKMYAERDAVDEAKKKKEVTERCLKVE